MSLQTALSGLSTAQTGLDTVSNDLANADTTAFKSEEALFEDMYPSGENNVAGMGASTEGMDTNESQGNLTSTGNPLDAAIQGNGYFLVSNNGTQQYTRDGAFQLSNSGVLQTISGDNVLGYAETAGGGLAGSLGAISVNTGAMAAKASTSVGITLDLNSGDSAIPTTTAFNAGSASTYDESTSVIAYDSLGNANSVQLYARQMPASGSSGTTWQIYAQPEAASGTSVGSASLLTTLDFNADGQLTSGGNPTMTVNWGNGAAPSNLTFNFTGTTNQSQQFAVAGTTNDGYAPGTYSSTSIASNGQIISTYSNGQTQVNGTLALANFINEEGLQPVTGNILAQTTTSGQPVINTPGTGQAGSLTGGSLEASNVSTSTDLVDLIQYQQAYQADTSVLQTEQQDSQRLVQI